MTKQDSKEGIKSKLTVNFEGVQGISRTIHTDNNIKDA